MKKADGLRWKRIPVGKGFAEISERHLGEIIVVNPDGSPDFRGKCPTCAGTEKADCAVCHGTTKTACPECTHRADAPACPSDCENGRTPCEVCEGVGLKK